MRLIQKHWRFALVLIASLGAMLLAHKTVVPKSDATSENIKSAEGKFKSLATSVAKDQKPDAGATAMSPEAIALRRARLEVSRGILNRQVAELSYQTLPGFRVGAADGDVNQQATRYQEILRATQNRLRFALNWGPKRIVKDASGDPDVGVDFAAVAGPSAMKPEKLLLRLDVLSRVADAARTSDLSRVTEFRFTDFAPNAEWKRRAPSIVGTTDPHFGTRLLSRLTVKMAARGTPAAVCAFIADVQRSDVDGARGRALTIDSFKVVKTDWQDSADDLVDFEATLAASFVKPDAEMPDPSREAAIKRLLPPTAAATPGKTDGAGSEFAGNTPVTPEGANTPRRSGR
jgi:hypothetical protein